MSVLDFNLRQTIFTASYATRDAEEVDEISHFHVSKNVAAKTEGMLILIAEDEWPQLIPSTIQGVVSLVTKIARQIDLGECRKSTLGPTKKRPYRSRNSASTHVSTANLLGLT